MHDGGASLTKQAPREAATLLGVGRAVGYRLAATLVGHGMVIDGTPANCDAQPGGVVTG
ncbi:hypothetical protein ACFPIJ_28950 [Dactylosporangium cerinum]|uniref:Uncharacterized protein n=1 Tax=Dactylosporangium cerinum TaxID=1434730 RepID=A0ABV9W0I8_9ACTN